MSDGTSYKDITKHQLLRASIAVRTIRGLLHTQRLGKFYSLLPLCSFSHFASTRGGGRWRRASDFLPDHAIDLYLEAGGGRTRALDD